MRECPIDRDQYFQPKPMIRSMSGQLDATLNLAFGQQASSYGGQSRNQMLPRLSPATIEVSLAVIAV